MDTQQDPPPGRKPPAAFALKGSRLGDPAGDGACPLSIGGLSGLVQASLRGAIQGMQQLVEQASADAQPGSRKHLQTLQSVLRFVHKTFPTEVVPEKAPAAGHDSAIDPERARAFGLQVASARKAAGLSRAKLAERACLSEQTIYNVETGTNTPTQSTILRLLAVHELGLDSATVPWRQPERSEPASSNCWIAPGYEPLRMFTELVDLLNNSRASSIDQTYAYLDHHSALHWFALANQSAYATRFRENLPLESMARKILDSIGRAGLDVVALGPGDGKSEVRLVQHLLSHGELLNGEAPDLRLFLLDVSQPLLSTAYQHAVETLGKRGVSTCAVQGNFHDWPQYTQFHYCAERSHRRRIAIMLGNTLGDLDNEARFFKHTLIGLAPGDLLLLDVQLAQGSTERPDEILRSDPAFTRGLSPIHKDWLGGPLLRYCRGALEIEFSCRLDVACQIPGCYTVDTLATVKLAGGKEKRFSVYRFKRYQPQRLVDLLRPLGWELLAEKTTGPAPDAPAHAVLLLRRISASFPL